MNLSQKKWISLGFASCALGFGVLIYSIMAITIEGLSADANHGGGGISALDIMSLLGGLALVAGAMATFWWVLKGADASRVRNIALCALASSAASLFAYPFVVTTIALGVITISRSSQTKSRPILIAVSIFAIVASLNGVIITFTTV
jgi:hypothetical protein